MPDDRIPKKRGRPKGGSVSRRVRTWIEVFRILEARNTNERQAFVRGERLTTPPRVTRARIDTAVRNISLGIWTLTNIPDA